jgi:hypothetical protein
MKIITFSSRIQLVGDSRIAPTQKKISQNGWVQAGSGQDKAWIIHL